MAEEGPSIDALIARSGATPSDFFKPVADLPKTYWEGLASKTKQAKSELELKDLQQKQDVFKEGLPTDPKTGGIDWTAANRKLLQSGGAGAVPAAVEIGKLQALPANNMPPPAFGGPSPAPQSSQPVPSSPRVVGDREGVNSGIYDAPAAPGQRPPIQNDQPTRGATSAPPVDPNRAQAAMAKLGMTPADLQDPNKRMALVAELRSSGSIPGFGRGPAQQPQPQQPSGDAPFQPRDPTYGGLTMRGMDAGQSIKYLREQAAQRDYQVRGSGQALRDQATQLEKAQEAEVAHFSKGNDALYTKAQEAMGASIEDAIKSTKTAHEKLVSLDIMKDALNRSKNIWTGPGSSFVLKNKVALSNALGIDIAGLDETQVVSKIGFGLSTQVVRAITARPTQMEVGMALANNPGLLLTPSGSKLMIDVLQQQSRQEAKLGELAMDQKNWPKWGQVVKEFYADPKNSIRSPFDHSKPMGMADVKKVVGANAESGLKTFNSSAEARKAGAKQFLDPDGNVRELH